MNKFASLALSSTVLAIVAFGIGPATAHHSYAMFDRTKSATMSGIVRTVQWTNPHVYLWVNATGEKGEAQIWGFEFGGGPNGLVRNGWTKETMKVGDKVTVKYHPLKDGRTGGEFQNVTFADGSCKGQCGEGRGGRGGAAE